GVGECLSAHKGLGLELRLSSSESIIRTAAQRARNTSLRWHFSAGDRLLWPASAPRSNSRGPKRQNKPGDSTADSPLGYLGWLLLSQKPSLCKGKFDA